MLGDIERFDDHSVYVTQIAKTTNKTAVVFTIFICSVSLDIMKHVVASTNSRHAFSQNVKHDDICDELNLMFNYQKINVFSSIILKKIFISVKVFNFNIFPF